MNLQEIIVKINDHTSKVWLLQRKLQEEQELLKKLTNKLREKCNHEFIPDYSQFDPCRTIYVCKTCNKSR